MDKPQNIVRIDFEISSLCNAKCPICPRYYSHSGEILPFKQTYWSIDDVKKYINLDIIQNLNHLYLCGNFGDPMANPDIYEICKYFRDNNPNMSIEISTNGGVGKTINYEKLSKINVNIRFAVDGYKEKNELYRVGVKWENLINNINSFTTFTKSENFGIQFLMWNETIDDIFNIIDILRKSKKGTLYLRKPFDKGNQSEVFDKKGCVSHFLTQITDERLYKYYETFWPVESLDDLYKELQKLLPFKTNSLIEGDYKKREKVYEDEELEYQIQNVTFTQEEINQINDKNIQTCESINFDNPYDLSNPRYSVYITHSKLLFPCCYIPPEVLVQMNHRNDREKTYQLELLNEMKSIGFDKFDISKSSLKDVFDSGILHEFAYKRLQNGNGFYLCKQICGKCA